MPVLQLTRLNSEISFAIWKIEESLDELMALYPLSKQDLTILNEQKVTTRKMEWLAARLALKALLDQQGLSPFSIVKDEFGKPHLKGNSTGISISHTKDYGGAVINSSGPTGIDIEYPKPQIQRIAKKFLHADEKNWAQEDMGKLTQIWSAKEALYKLHGRTQLTFASQLHVEAPQADFPTKGHILENDQQDHFQLSYYQIATLLICIAY